MAWSSFPSLPSIASNEYDVFLSFRGQDTRYKFTSHLHACLKRWKIKTYMDQDLQKGDEISKTLHRAIQKSKVAIVIFSEKYATSSWCLDELVKIIECTETQEQCLLPIFYHVEPSDVRFQKYSYAKAFAKHEQGCRYNKEKLDSWKQALTKAASLSGYVISDTSEYRKEDELVEKIAEDVSMRLQAKQLAQPVERTLPQVWKTSLEKSASAIKQRVGASLNLTFGKGRAPSVDGKLEYNALSLS